MTDCCPVASRDGHNLPGLVDECVPSVAAVVDDIVEGFENSVRQPVLPHELPDIFLAVEFGCAWRELQERDVVWNLEGLGAMPAGLIEEEYETQAGRTETPTARSPVAGTVDAVKPLHGQWSSSDEPRVSRLSIP